MPLPPGRATGRTTARWGGGGATRGPHPGRNQRGWTSALRDEKYETFIRVNPSHRSETLEMLPPGKLQKNPDDIRRRTHAQKTTPNARLMQQRNWGTDEASQNCDESQYFF